MGSRKVIFLFDMAGVCSVLSKIMGCELVYHDKENIGSEISRFYKRRGYRSFKKTLLMGIIKSLPCNIVHISSVDLVVPLFRLLGKKVVLHYHGSDLMDNPQSIIHLVARSFANAIVCNREDMMGKCNTLFPIRKEYLPNIVDDELFSTAKYPSKKSVCFVSSNLEKELIINKVKGLDSTCDIIDLDVERQSYANMPSFLAEYEMLYDIKIKYHAELTALSTTALQMLSLGRKVYHQGKTITSLPEEHKPKNVISKLQEIYQFKKNRYVKKLYRHGNLKILDMNGQYYAELKEKQRTILYPLGLND